MWLWLPVRTVNGMTIRHSSALPFRILVALTLGTGVIVASAIASSEHLCVRHDAVSPVTDGFTTWWAR